MPHTIIIILPFEQFPNSWYSVVLQLIGFIREQRNLIAKQVYSWYSVVLQPVVFTTTLFIVLQPVANNHLSIVPTWTEFTWRKQIMWKYTIYSYPLVLFHKLSIPSSCLPHVFTILKVYIVWAYTFYAGDDCMPIGINSHNVDNMNVTCSQIHGIRYIHCLILKFLSWKYSLHQNCKL